VLLLLQISPPAIFDRVHKCREGKTKEEKEKNHFEDGRRRDLGLLLSTALLPAIFREESFQTAIPGK
jgi:hypothetical protein